MSIFSKVPTPKVRTSNFNLSHEVKTTTKLFQLTPFLSMDVMPGDSFKVNTEMLVRLAPMFAPLMHRINVYTHFFFVPYRLLWEDWESFITQSVDGRFQSGLSLPEQIPYVNFRFANTDPQQRIGFLGSGTLADYLGCNYCRAGVDGSQNATGDINVNPLWFLAYQKIWNDYYRDENLQDPVVDTISWYGPNTVTVNSPANLPDTDWQSMFKLRNRAWQKDYFTSALPWTQKGDAAVLPLGGKAPFVQEGGYVDDPSVSFTGPSPAPGTRFDAKFRHDVGSSDYTIYGDQTLPSGSSNQVTPVVGLSDTSVSVDGYADLTAATAVTINELRRANALQRWLEINARGGTRYVEQLAAHFHIRPQDSRLQRAEYLGGGKSPVTISEVLQTSNSTAESTPQANMAGHGISASINHAFTRRKFPEHGVVIGILSIMPKPNYMQGANRFFGKRGYLDFAWPAFANLGEQPVYNFELYNDGIPADMTTDTVFGYAPRYSEYKYMPDRICGNFRDSMDNWHMGRIFANDPQLNSQFISGEGFSPNVFSVEGPEAESPFWIQIYNDIKAIRPLPYFGTPSL